MTLIVPHDEDEPVWNDERIFDRHVIVCAPVSVLTVHDEAAVARGDLVTRDRDDPLDEHLVGSPHVLEDNDVSPVGSRAEPVFDDKNPVPFVKRRLHGRPAYNVRPAHKNDYEKKHEQD